jgi:hypothetical protein
VRVTFEAPGAKQAMPLHFTFDMAAPPPVGAAFYVSRYPWPLVVTSVEWSISQTSDYDDDRGEWSWSEAELTADVVLADPEVSTRSVTS